MGLDMYLSAKRYLSEYDENDKEVRTQVNAVPIPGKGLMQINEVTAEAMYWRKANAIHAWFVKNVQNGVDDCGEYYVPKEMLGDLREICSEVLADLDKAEELLAPQSGFFFGSTAVDEYYISDLRYTIEAIDRLLETDNMDRWTFYYSSSW